MVHQSLMSPRSLFQKHEIVDLVTGERKDIKIGEEGALLTSSYIVTGFVSIIISSRDPDLILYQQAENFTSGVVYCKNRLQIIDRKTNEKREVELKDYRKGIEYKIFKNLIVHFFQLPISSDLCKLTTKKTIIP